ncbi:glycosyltransferase [Wenzhouxiangella sediminis]|uniref:Glycosyltransferase n=1 Tax=Wenzhouxiangella sediminis TaxID=1792836 RepID=A0A3E1K6C3_9GAMM|nr:glycosyltransferase [Wenzhouxiangella sediminis]RFF29577.1 glycosyltransferase [Wenzhouxiangella sediminis]
MNVLHIVAGLHPESGGPSRTVVQLSDTLAEMPGLAVQLVSQGRPGDPQVVSAQAGVSRHIGLGSRRISAGLALPGRRALHDAIATNPPHLMHNHGIWSPLNHWAARVAKDKDIPLLVQPRGMLEPWALAWRSWKKKLALWAYQRRDLESASVLVATAEQEAEGLRWLGLRQPIAVIPNGVEFDFASAPRQQHERTGLTTPRRALFLSRIHPKKGLLNLLEAWASLDSPDWVLQLAGPDEGGHLAEVQQSISALGLQNRVQYLGSIDDKNKSTVYEAADLFILPSFSENFGVVVAEALSHGLPVIATHGTPWQGLELHRCGWWVEPTVNELASALRDAFSKDPGELYEMGARGREYALEFEWDSIARQTADVYRWILGEMGRPGCVHLD